MNQPFACILTIALLVGTSLRAQEPVPGGLEAEAQGTAQPSPLGARQQRIKRLLNDLEGKFGELATKLEEEQPEQAEKLKEAFVQSKELLLMQRMDEITTLLDAAKLESATDEQTQIVSDLKALIDLLLYEEDEYERLQKEIERLEKWKEALDGLIQEESELQEESEILEDPEQAKAALDAQIQKAKDLVKKQEELLEKTEENDGSNVDATDELADAQAALQKETEALAEELASSEDASQSAESAQQQASQSLSQAAQQQRQAEQQLGQGKPKEASSAEKEALAEMQKAVDALEKERQRLENQDAEETSKELAQQQSEAAAEAEELGDEMAEAGEPQEGEASPAESVQNAQQQMNQAAQQLGQNEPGKAAENQERALEELNEAREEVERQLNELRDQAQQEQIARLEEVFVKMLERQRLVTGGTKGVAERRGGDENRLRRADRIQLRELAKEERGLEEDAKAAEQLLVDDGTSVVFRDIVGFLQQEISNVAAMMERQRTGMLVQQAHLEIEATLQELIAALENSGAGQQQQQQQQPPQEGQQQQQQRQSLFPPLAEIKLLKFTQERINRQTLALERAGQQAGVEDLLQDRFDATADMQDKLTNMARQVATQWQPTMTQEDPNAID